MSIKNKPIKLYNSLSNKVENFKPIKDSHVGLYTCGPTVYNRVHIGNLRTFIIEDTLRRMLKLNGYIVNHVMNITDVDDKIIAKSHEQYPNDEPRVALKKLTNKYEAAVLDDLTQLGIALKDTIIVRATEHINDMQQMIRKISHKYLVDDGIYFDISKYRDYGKLVKLDRKHEHHRVKNDEYNKEQAADFALWKTAKPAEPYWEFKLDSNKLNGRPGWHIECSAMSSKYLGKTFDIHTGGVDLKFPHHENELAQSYSANKRQMANYFIHIEHLLVDGKKMSKSLNNFFTLDDLIKKGIHPLSFRLLVLQANYRQQMNFTWESLKAAQAYLQSLYRLADKQFQPMNKSSNIFDAKPVMDNIIAALNNNLGTAQALSYVSNVIDQSDQNTIRFKQDFSDFLAFLDQVFGLNLCQRKPLNIDQQQLLKARESARMSGSFKDADMIRQRLEQQGILLQDTKEGVFWYRKV